MSARRPGHNHIKYGGQTGKKTALLSGLYFRTLIDLQAEDRDGERSYLAEDPSSGNVCITLGRLVILCVKMRSSKG